MFSTFKLLGPGHENFISVPKIVNKIEQYSHVQWCSRQTRFACRTALPGNSVGVTC